MSIEQQVKTVASRASGWAAANGIDVNNFGPMNDCIRSQMITFLYRPFTDATA